jgi:hypothetical protein
VRNVYVREIAVGGLLSFFDMRPLQFHFLWIVLLAGPAASEQKPISFGSYPVTLKFHGTPVSPQKNTAFSRKYRTVIREGVSNGPNFADHYTVAIWGCGSSCAMFSIVDAVDGRVYDFPSGVSWSADVDGGITYRRNSRAIHVVGYLNETGEQMDCWYVWNGLKLTEISGEPAKHLPS